MDSTWLERLIELFSEAGLEAAENALRTVRTDDPHVKMLLGGLAEYIDKHGPQGIDMFVEKIGDLVDGEKPDLDYDNIALSSAYLFIMEEREAGQKQALKEMAQKLGLVLRPVITGLIMGLMKK